MNENQDERPKYENGQDIPSEEFVNWLRTSNDPQAIEARKAIAQSNDQGAQQEAKSQGQRL